METPFPPFEPDEEVGSRKSTGLEDNSQTRLRDIPLRKLVPSFLTLLAICSGLTAMRFAYEGRVEWALAAIILAAFLDGIDGRVARFLKSATRFGAQMDSLADFVNFGVAPAIVIYFSLLEGLRSAGWIAVLFYAICACLRLARFNVQLDNPKRPDFQKDFFVGVPAPAGAMIVLLPIYLLEIGVEATPTLQWLTSFYVIVCGFLLVSNLPTYSGKKLGAAIPRTLVLPMILLSFFVIAMLLSYPWQVLSILALIYLAGLPFGRLYYNRLEKTYLAKAK